MLGLCIVGFAAVFVWNRIFPPAFNVDPHDWHVEYEFRDEGLFREFVVLNGGWSAQGEVRDGDPIDGH